MTDAVDLRTQINTRLAEIRILQKELHDEAIGKGREVMQVAFREFFDANPDVEAFRWTQYAPYFNDGEACVFSVHRGDYEFRTAATDEEFEDEYFDGFADGAAEAWTATITAILAPITDDELLEMFDDHAQVTVNRDGSLESEEYSHD
jgi:hypothetical protein